MGFAPKQPKKGQIMSLQGVSFKIWSNFLVFAQTI